MSKKAPKMTLPVVKAPKPKPAKRTADQKRDAVESRITTKLLTKEEKRRLLRRIAYSSRATPQEKIKAIETDNRMAGHNEPDKVAVNVTEGFWNFANKKEAEADEG